MTIYPTSGSTCPEIGHLGDSKLIRGNFQTDGVLYRIEEIEGKLRLQVYKHVETFFLNADELKEALK